LTGEVPLARKKLLELGSRVDVSLAVMLKQLNPSANPRISIFDVISQSSLQTWTLDVADERKVRLGFHCAHATLITGSRPFLHVSKCDVYRGKQGSASRRF